MIFQALGTQDINTALDTAQIVTLLVFITFYVPCISTFAIMHRTLGRAQTGFSVLLSVGVALLLSGLVRVVMGIFV
jgi:ferrous iron transport protein B